MGAEEGRRSVAGIADRGQSVFATRKGLPKRGGDATTYTFERPDKIRSICSTTVSTLNGFAT